MCGSVYSFGCSFVSGVKMYMYFLSLDTILPLINEDKWTKYRLNLFYTSKESSMISYVFKGRLTKIFCLWLYFLQTRYSRRIDCFQIKVCHLESESNHVHIHSISSRVSKQTTHFFTFPQNKMHCKHFYLFAKIVNCSNLFINNYF